MVATDLFFSEYVEGSSLNKALEIANFTGDTVDLSEYTIAIYFNGSTSAGTTIPLSGTLADGEVFVVADDGADAAILAAADLTTTSSLFNGDDAIALLKNGAIVDVFGQIGVDPGTSWIGGGADVTLRRLPSITDGDTDGSNAFDASIEWESLPQDTFDGLGSHAVDGGITPLPTVFINEVLVSTTSTDVEFIEIFGEPGTSLAGLSVLNIEGGTGAGSIDNRFDLPGDAVIGDNGFYLIGNSLVAGALGVTPNAEIPANFFENSSSTIALVETATITGTSVSGGETVIDAVALQDSDGGTFFYGAPVLGPDSSFYPSAVTRSPDGGAFQLIDAFSPAGANTTPTAGTVAAQPLVINEVYASHTGTDNTEFIELFGVAGTSLDGLSLIVVEGDSGAAGAIDRQIDFTAADVLGNNGFFLVGNPAGLQANYEVTPNLIIGDNFLENSSFTIALVETSSISGTSVTGSEVVLDTVALTDGDAEDTFFFDAPVVGPDGFFFPAGTRRIADGVDTDTVADWAISNFFLGEANTPTAGSGIEPPPPPVVHIYDIQGAAHTSPLVGQTVSNIPGIVTAVDSNGFYLQDPTGDGNIATSDGIFVFTSSRPTVSVGDSILVSGTVSEFVPGGAGTGNLSVTQIGGTPTITVVSSGNSLPTTVVLGVDRTPPTQVIDNDQSTAYNVLQGGGVYEPTTDGLDFYESLEGMRVMINDALAVSGTNQFGEIFTVANNGAGATGLSTRGTINIAPDDFNPERIQVQFDSGILPGFSQNVNVGAQLGDVTGVVGYNFGNFEVNVTEAFTPIASTLQAETTSLTPSTNDLTIVSYNVLNLDPNDNDGDADIANGRFTTIAQHIVNNLGGPDIIGLQEIQDNDGSVNSSITAADLTLQRLIDEIAAISGITYAFIDNPFIGDDTSGGQPGGNIRTAFLYNPDRVSLVPNSVQTIGSQATGGAFFDTRLPLVATFEFNGQEVTVVNNHFSSKGGSSPLFGATQPAADLQENPSVNGSLDQRRAQAEAVKGFVDVQLTSNPDANIVVVGDFNEFEFISPLNILEQSLTNLTEILPENERYTFIFDGNSQSLDHILVSSNLASDAEFDIVHVNTEFAATSQRASDHDPLLTRLTLAPANMAPVAVNDTATLDLDNGETTGKINVLANDSDPDGDTLQIVSFADPTPESGVVTQNADQTFTYNANGFFAYLAAGETATDRFSYTISDGSLTASAEVTVTIQGPDNLFNSGTAFRFSQGTNGGANAFGFDGDAFFISGQGVSGQPKFQDFDPFLEEAARVFGGVVEVRGTINDQRLPIGQGPNILNVNANNVTIGGRSTSGNYRIQFDSATEANVFKTFVQRMLNEINANDAVANDPTDFRFDALTGMGDTEARLFFDDVNEQFGFTTDNGQTQTRFDELELFVEGVADLFGGTQLRDGSFNAVRIAAGQTPNQIRVNNDVVVIGGRSVSGQFSFDFANTSTANTFSDSVGTLFDNIKEAGAIATGDII